jgi:hypothetical protein
MNVHLYIIGSLFILLALVHIIFPKYFDWKIELQRISLINRQMMTVHTFFIAVILFLMGLLCLTSADDLVQSEFGRRIAFGLGIFWFIRLLVQFFGYSHKLWKGKAFETSVHILFTCFWIYVTSVFFLISFGFSIIP